MIFRNSLPMLVSTFKLVFVPALFYNKTNNVVSTEDEVLSVISNGLESIILIFTEINLDL